MDFKALEKEVIVPSRYDLSLSEIQELCRICDKEGQVEAISMAFLLGWKRRESKARNDLKKVSHSLQR